MSPYDEIRAAIILGLDVEQHDPKMAKMISSFTKEQVDWISLWLAGEGFGRLPTARQ